MNGGRVVGIVFVGARGSVEKRFEAVLGHSRLVAVAAVIASPVVAPAMWAS
jgi:hypothetical protein